jgi:hypothetical protein
MCGVRMATTGFVDYKPARLLNSSGPAPFAGVDEVLPAGALKLDNGYVQFVVESNHALVADDAGDYAVIYVVPHAQKTTLRASCSLTVTGQSQWAAPIVWPSKN